MAISSNTFEPFKIGNSRSIKITIKDKVTKAAIDVSGDKFYFTVKDSADHLDADAVLQASVVAPADATSQGGVAVIPVTSADTTAVEPGSYVYDIVWLKLTSSPGNRETIQQGDVWFEHAVTRAQS